LAALVGEPPVISTDIPETFEAEMESETVKVRVGVKPAPEGGLTELATGAPPVTFQVPSATQPEVTPGSTASR
jgi:hypothetical protein